MSGPSLALVNQMVSKQKAEDEETLEGLVGEKGAPEGAPSLRTETFRSSRRKVVTLKQIVWRSSGGEGISPNTSNRCVEA